MLQNFCEFAEDYPSTLGSLKIPANMRASERVIQFPFALPVVEEKTEEELARIAEKRKEQGKKLQEMAAKNRMEKVCIAVFRLLRLLPPHLFPFLSYRTLTADASTAHAKGN